MNVEQRFAAAVINAIFPPKRMTPPAGYRCWVNDCANKPGESIRQTIDPEIKRA